MTSVNERKKKGAFSAEMSFMPVHHRCCISFQFQSNRLNSSNARYRMACVKIDGGCYALGQD